MLTFGHRVLAALPVLVGVSLLTFFVFRLLPGDAAEQLLGAEATAEQVRQLRAELEIDGAASERYFKWLRAAVAGDLGRSVTTGQPVQSLIAERLPVTLELMIYALTLALGLAIPAAMLGARKPGGLADRLMTLLSLAFLSAPGYVLAVALVLLLAVYVPLFPSIGFTPVRAGLAANVGSLTLPALSLALPLFGFYSQFLRRDIVEQLQSEAYVVTAAAKGIGPWEILVRHVLRNSLFGLLTIVGLHLGTLVGGAVIVEQMFALPGVGQLLLRAVTNRDVVVAQGIILVLTCTTVTATLLIDLLYAALDPRVRDRVR